MGKTKLESYEGGEFGHFSYFSQCKRFLYLDDTCIHSKSSLMQRNHCFPEDLKNNSHLIYLKASVLKIQIYDLKIQLKSKGIPDKTYNADWVQIYYVW